MTKNIPHLGGVNNIRLLPGFTILWLKCLAYCWVHFLKLINASYILMQRKRKGALVICIPHILQWQQRHLCLTVRDETCVLMVKSYPQFILIWTPFKCQGGAQKKNTCLSWKKKKKQERERGVVLSLACGWKSNAMWKRNPRNWKTSVGLQCRQHFSPILPTNHTTNQACCMTDWIFTIIIKMEFSVLYLKHSQVNNNNKPTSFRYPHEKTR